MVVNILNREVRMSPQDRQDAAVVNLLILAALVVVGVLCCRQRQLSTSAFGTAFWAGDKLLRNWGMLGRYGLVLGRTLGGTLIRIPRYTHILLVGGTGSGKGVGLVIPNLLHYGRGSVIVFDPKGDLYATTARTRRRKGRVIRLAPFGTNSDRWNLFDAIPNDALLIDNAKAMAEAIVARAQAAHEPHWDDKAAQIITAVIVFVLRRLPPAERNLNSAADLACDPLLLHAVGDKLKEMGGIPARMGATVHALFEKDRLLTKEGAGIISTVARYLDFLASDRVAASVADSTFDVRELLRPGVTLYLQIPLSQLTAQRGLLRCWVSTLLRTLGELGSESDHEILCLLDECSALNGLVALEETLTRGRSSGLRLFLAYQSDSQVLSAFKDKPSLIYDNAATQLYLGASSIETAERLSKMLGSWTQSVESFGENSSFSHSSGSSGSSNQTSTGRSANVAPQGRPLMYPDEILRMSDDFLFAFQSGFPAPIVARRIRFYADPAFNPAAPRPRVRWWRVRSVHLLYALSLVVFCGLVVRAKVNGYGYWAPPDPPARRYEQKSLPPKPKHAVPTPQSGAGR